MKSLHAPADHPVARLFRSTFPACEAIPSRAVLDLGVSSLDLIDFLCRCEAELSIELESLLMDTQGALTLRCIMDVHDRNTCMSIPR